MTYVYPDFYFAFKCISSKCKHSCCRGWEIDIDSDSMLRYDAVGGELGCRLKKCISAEPTPHFILTDDEACPFLREDGLCSIITELGEDSLCDICAEHPRFYNTYPERLETGLGLCCEEAARLLTEGKEPLEFIEETDTPDTPGELTPGLKIRSGVFSILREQGEPLTVRMEKAMKLTGSELMPFDCAGIAQFYKKLECMDEAWTSLLEKLAQYGNTVYSELSLNDILYERIAEYFVFRHFAGGDTEHDRALRLQFAFLSTRIICCLNTLGASDALRMYSAEIEYSDENVDAILAYIGQFTKNHRQAGTLQ